MKLTDFIMLLVEDDPNDILLIQRAFAKACLVNPLKVVRDVMLGSIRVISHTGSRLPELHQFVN